MSGIYLVTLPIGNNEDISLRALRTLKEIRNIYCEDTRIFKELCKHIGVDYSEKRILSYHDHSGERNTEKILGLAKLEPCIFVSDAGSPLISDPAFPLIKGAIALDIPLFTIPGVSSVITALELSGLAPIPFHFYGFLGRDKADLTNCVDLVKSSYGTHIFFEGKSRILKTLAVLSNELADFDFALGRELTKTYESMYRFKGKEFDQIKEQIVEKGEYVLLISNGQKSASGGTDKALVDLANTILEKGSKPKVLAKLLSEITGKPTKEVYETLTKTRQ